MALADDIKDLLTEFGAEIVTDLQSNLKTKLAAKSSKYGTKSSKPTSSLSASIKFRFSPKPGSTVFVLEMNEYGGAVDSGRIAAPVEWNKASGYAEGKLERWARTSGFAQKVRLEDAKGNKRKKPLAFDKATKAAAFLVARKLKREGYEGNNFFTEIINDGRMQELNDRLKELIKGDVSIEIINAIK